MATRLKIWLHGLFEQIVTCKESVNERFKQSMEWNGTHPYREITVLTDNYTILCMADTHVGGTVNLDKFLAIAKATNATAVAMVGDLTTGHAKDYAVLQQHLTNYTSFPMFLMVGNHDLHFSGWKEFYARFGSSTYLVTVKTPIASDLFICLDTGSGTLGSDQFDWLSRWLKLIGKNYRNCFMLTHNNLFRFRHTETGNPLTEELLALIDLFTRYQVDVFIAGHDHKYDAVKFGNTTYIVMNALKDGDKNAGYLQLTVKNGVIAYENKAI
jgi:predicted phosphodiesterase